MHWHEADDGDDSRRRRVRRKEPLREYLSMLRSNGGVQFSTAFISLINAVLDLWINPALIKHR